MKLCENCGREHGGSYGSGRFCGSFCARSFVSKQNREEKNKKVSESVKRYFETHPEAREHSRETAKRIHKIRILTSDYERSMDKFCLFCGLGLRKATLERWRDTLFCSLKCSIEYRRKQYIESGLCKNNRTLRKYLIEIRGYKCEGCDNYEWRGIPIRLELHHIDGYKKNNKPENLELLCPNCHCQTDNYSFKNIDNETKKRIYFSNRNPNGNKGSAWNTPIKTKEIAQKV